MSALGGTTALVTGASRGIGRAIALALAGAGARCWAVGRSAELLEQAAGAVAGSGSLRPWVCDLTRAGDVAALARAVEQEQQGLDLLVHSAGVIHLGPLSVAPVEQLDEQYAANVRAPYVLTQAVLALVKARAGQIVFINSSVTGNPRPSVVQFAATQHALRGLADCLRSEVNGDGVRVLSVFPGRTATPRQAELHRREGKPYHPELLMQPEDVAATVLHAVTLPRTVEMTSVHLRPMVKS